MLFLLKSFNHLIALRAITECDISVYHPEDRGIEKLPRVLIGGAEAWGEEGGGVAMEGFDGEKRTWKWIHWGEGGEGSRGWG